MRLNGEMVKTTTFYIKCSAEEAAAIRASAKGQQRTIHNWLKVVVMAATMKKNQWINEGETVMPETKISKEPRHWTKIRVMEYPCQANGGGTSVKYLRYYLRDDGLTNIEAFASGIPSADDMMAPDELEQCFGVDNILTYSRGGIRTRTEQEFDQEFTNDLQEHNGHEIT
jgi:hypothetical protein